MCPDAGRDRLEISPLTHRSRRISSLSIKARRYCESSVTVNKRGPKICGCSISKDRIPCKASGVNYRENRFQKSPGATRPDFVTMDAYAPHEVASINRGET